MILYLLHIQHGDGSDTWELNESLLGAAMSMVGYVEEHWSEQIPDEEISKPLTKGDLDYYFSDSGELASVVQLGTKHLTAEAIHPNSVWKAWADTFKESVDHEHR